MKKKIAVILGNFSIGARPLDFHFNNIYESSRALTGTDLSFVEISKALHKRGHDVHMFTLHAQPYHKPTHWEGIPIYNFDERFSVVDDSFDVILSINEPDAIRGMNQKPLKICWQFLNDFTYCHPGFDDFVDKWIGVSDVQVNHLVSQPNAPAAEKWSIVPLGCNPDNYRDERVEGRCVWTSSWDRGLHWLLSCWPTIKKAVPSANLRIFYHFERSSVLDIEPNDPNMHVHTREMGQRLRYCLYAIERLKPLGVECVGSVSANSMIKEMNEASVLAFPADPVAFTEGYSLSILNALASYTVPCITDADCLFSIYKDSGAVIVPRNMNKHLDKYAQEVIKYLNNKNESDRVIAKCTAFAKTKDWKLIAEQMEQEFKSKG